MDAILPLTDSLPLVSIVIPCYNAGQWLNEALDSASMQTWPQIEIILVDDGSTDNSLEIARRFDGAQITIVSQQNRGASAARNHGLALAKGEYVQFLDADDILEKDKIARQMQELLQNGRNCIASCAWTRFSGNVSSAIFREEPNWKNLTGLEFLLLHYESGWMMQPAAWLCPRHILDSAGPWDESLSLNDDGEYFCRVMLAAEKIIFCRDARVYYRSEIAGSLSRRGDAKALLSLWKSTELNCERLLEIDHSPRTKAAAASGWMRLAFELYPTLKNESREAERRCFELGGTPHPPPVGHRFQRISRFIGWRAAKRLRLFLSV